MGLLTLIVGAVLGRYLNYIQPTEWQRELTAFSGFIAFFFWLLVVQAAPDSISGETAVDQLALALAGMAPGMFSRYIINERGPNKGKSDAATEDPGQWPTKQPWLLFRAQWLVPAYWVACIFCYRLMQ